MPLRWFECPDGGRIEVQKCLTEGGCRMANRCATRSYLKMVSAERKWIGKPSTTQLIGGTILAFLRLTTDYAVSPDDRAFMIHGTRAHGNIASYDDDYSLIEERLEGKDTQVTGIFDVFEVEDGKSTLVDYKTSGSYKVAKALGFYMDIEETGGVYKSGKRKGEKKTRKILKRDDSMIDRWEWELQLNKYRIELERRGFHVDQMRIQCIVRDGNTWIAKSRGVFRNIYYFRIARLEDEKVSRYFEHKRKALEQALRQGYWNKVCTARENWDGIRCTHYCEVAEFCPLGKYLKAEKEKEDMPIKRLSTIRRLPRLGIISLGKKVKKDGKEYPKEVDHFILRPQTASEEEKERLIAKFHSLFGEKPKSIRIMLPVGDPDTVFSQWYCRYGQSSGLKCKGDGEKAICMSDEFTEGLKVIGKEESGLPAVECSGEECVYYQNKQCRRLATLQVLIPELPGAGVWQIRTGSFNSIVNLNSCMDFIMVAAGRFHMLPLTLERREQQITHDGKTRKHYILHLNMDFELAKLQQFSLIDPEKILLELPAAAEGTEDIAFEETSEKAIHNGGGDSVEMEPTEEMEKQKGGKDNNGDRVALLEKVYSVAKEKGVVVAQLEEWARKQVKAGNWKSFDSIASLSTSYLNQILKALEKKKPAESESAEASSSVTLDFQSIVDRLAKKLAVEPSKLMEHSTLYESPEKAIELMGTALTDDILAGEILASFNAWKEEKEKQAEPTGNGDLPGMSKPENRPE